jgi:hypothetical protein
MVRFETEIELSTKQDVIYALQEIIRQIENDYSCGYINGGSWSCEGEEGDEEEDYRLVYVDWDVSDSEYETFVNKGIPRRIFVPMSVDVEDIVDWLSREYGYCVESYTIEEE